MFIVPQMTRTLAEGPPRGGVVFYGWVRFRNPRFTLFLVWKPLI